MYAVKNKLQKYKNYPIVFIFFEFYPVNTILAVCIRYGAPPYFLRPFDGFPLKK